MMAIPRVPGRAFRAAIVLSGLLAASAAGGSWARTATTTAGPVRGVAEGPQEDRPRDERAALMRRKLDHAQRILGGLAEGRFGAVARSARSLRELSEVAARHNLPTDDYRRFSEEFRRLTEALAEKAEARDLDGATLVNVQLTLNCVECHKYVRIQTLPPAPPR